MSEEARQTGQKSIPDLIREIELGAFNPKQLNNTLLDQCIEYLCHEQGLSMLSVAHLLKRNRHTIENRAKKILKKRAEELRVRGIDVYELAMRLDWITKLVMNAASRGKDWRLYMEAYHKYIDKLQDLGVIYRSPVGLRIGYSPAEEKAKLDDLRDEMQKREEAAMTLQILVESGAFGYLPERPQIGNGHDNDNEQ